MHLTPKDEDRLLLFLAAELSRRRRSRGLRLTYPEARALIADEVAEAARGGASVSEAAAFGASLLTDDDVAPGVADLLGSVQVEGFFDDGQKLVTVHDPIRPGTGTAPTRLAGDEHTPGEYLLADEDIVINGGRDTAAITVVNTGDRPVQVGSHFHFFEANRALLFDRRAAFGMRLDIPSGTAVRFEPGAEHDVELVAFGGERVITGLNDMTNGPTDGALPAATFRDLRAAGFLDTSAGDVSGRNTSGEDDGAETDA
ncbi:Urease subunit alpha [Gordonia terrae]|uniref:Urease subunit beta n=1 Tax=Gordonia terrae TaxID=2055 RepID=A0A2I1R2W0_9ACTN|nr:urease subunit beta [Gordonia terrae]PKZ63466.1 Urease subunit alpha [Gordonia terrae]